MNLTQILEMLPPRVYVRGGELVMQPPEGGLFSSRLLPSAGAILV
jgi:hypothetical protein